MVKHKDYKKSDLIQILSSSVSKERNKAVKLLKRFEPLPRKHLDGKFDPKDVVVQKYSAIKAYMCWRCDKVKQTNVKVHWDTIEGMKTICTSCHGNLLSIKEVERVRKDNNTNTELLKNINKM
ncbi:conserved Plasmodium protein, unknown function [Plasmodium chabaudi chabaudi]|uniref:Uncharacterized protein n=1 Tax=Plasmodium chabaudi chabaudi TaxID=31271 RepID=A0A077X914_PLACU|nr:conserved protein, unknown function [Plasmodium chabaudi chabaudi]SCM00709.1 conserved Plasmodium protein, unknown function [Plasmodium chabaudi chabaudi]VTZ67509.1 conserved protein, unknown function [Plasmodium chabaudi chabaudi]|eukprot:XP_016655221.1 conserved Plasmodium protein, unknown function [Plasmodium chabaudi chabaudi]